MTWNKSIVRKGWSVRLGIDQPVQAMMSDLDFERSMRRKSENIRQVGNQR